MRLLFIRHGDPDYVHDSLTEKGVKEASLLADFSDKMNIGICYQSPFGRAKKTASYTLERLGKDVTTFDWLHEFEPELDLNKAPADLVAAYPDAFKKEDGTFVNRICWDILPSYLAKHPELLSLDGYKTSDVAKYSKLNEVSDYVLSNFDALLASFGYERDGLIYRVKKECRETLVFYCHYGVTCLIMAHLLNTSPFVMWNGMAMAPTSVCEFHTEEREEGIAWFRASKVGDISHLSIGGEEPSFAARFCEVYSDFEQRH